MSNLYKSGWIVVNDDVRVIDANEMVKKRLRENASSYKISRSDSFPVEEEGDFSSGLEAEKIDTLLDPDGEGTVLKNRSLEELEVINQDLEAARGELEQVKEETSRMLTEANVQIAEMRASALEEAKTQGYREGYDQGMAEARIQKQVYLDKQVQLEDDYRQQVEALEPEFIETLTGIYEHIFKVDLSAYHSLVVTLLTDAMQKTDTARHYIVHVSKQDYPAVSAAREKILEETGTLAANLEIISDMTLSASQCMIETEDGIYDCSLGTELEELRRKLMLISYKR